jgi:hypothetical protein
MRSPAIVAAWLRVVKRASRNSAIRALCICATWQLEPSEQIAIGALRAPHREASSARAEHRTLRRPAAGGIPAPAAPEQATKSDRLFYSTVTATEKCGPATV